MINLQDFSERIMRPMIIRQIESGNLDAAIYNDEDVQEIVRNDPELLAAWELRLINVNRP